MRKPALVLTAAVSALALAGAVGAGVASADPTGSATPRPSASPSARAEADGDRPQRRQRDLTARALHGEVTLGGKRHRVVHFQRGAVDRVDDSSVVVRSADGFVGTYVISPETRIRAAGEAAGVDDLEIGDRVRVVAAEDGSTLTATRLVHRGK